MEHILITGSNRGIGFALVEAFLGQEETHIIASCRNPESATDLQELRGKFPDKLSVVALDVSDEISIQTAVQEVQAQFGIVDVLVNNAGIYPNEAQSRQFGQLNADAVGHVLTTNAVSAVMVTQGFIPLLKKSGRPRVVMVSSQMGSLTRAGSSGIAYRMSKAAMNMGAKVISQVLSGDGIAVITTHPGHVATDMGGKTAPVQPDDSAYGLMTLIQNLTMEQTGSYYNYNGDIIPW